MKFLRFQFFGAVLALSYAVGVAAQTSDEDELALSYGDKSFVSIATGSPVSATRAPAVATVITAEDIRATGATDLDEILETVPGLHVSRSTLANAPVYSIRGVDSNTNPEVLMLVNGIPVNRIFEGNRGDVWGGMPLENIQRIEVIRGPGSALYGADAFSGVINVITKTASDINGTLAGVRAGSFRTRDAWVLHGGKFGAIDVAAYARVGKTDGYDKTVAADAQTGWDSTFGTHASHAPGPMDNQRDSVDASLDLSHTKWRFRTSYKERSNVGSGVGAAQALDPTGSSYSQTVTSDLTWQDPNFAKNLDVSMQANYLGYTEKSDLVLFPAGAFGGGFSDGLIGNPYKWERHEGLSATGFFTGLEKHRIRVGTGYTKEEIYKVQETKNYNPDFSPIGTGSVQDVVDVSDTAPFLRPHSRLLRYIYAQDEWSIARDWELTAGLRHDHYSDFGETTNPRLALVWDAAYNMTAKVLYGTAFRAPSFTELYNINNPVLLGNPDLKPEKVKTLETAFSWQPMDKVQVGLNLFRFRISDMLRVSGVSYINGGEQTGRGFELEATWDVTRELRLSGNFAHQRLIDEASNTDAGNAPQEKLYARVDWRFTPGWAANAQVNWVMGRERVALDPRPSVPDYHTVDLTLRTDKNDSRWSAAISVRNLFDADAREPSPYTQPFINIPGDIPLPGRSFYVQVQYKL